MFHDKFPERNAETFQDNNVTMFHVRFATMFHDNNVVMYPSKNVQTNRGNNVEVFLVNSVSRYHSRYVMPANLHTEEENRWCSNRKSRLSYSFRSVTKCNTTNTLSDYDL